MKPVALALTLLLGITSALAETPPSPQLVRQYLQQAQPEKAIAAEVEGYAQQLGAHVRPEDKAQLREYLDATIGWNAIKDDYAALVAKTYTAAELKAAIAFLRSKEGLAITRKNQDFARAMAALIARNAQQAMGQYANRMRPDDEAPGASATELVAMDVEERELNGQKYFVGQLENRGSRPARGVQVEINLFAGGKFVDQYTSYLNGAVVPGAKRYFKVSCGCKDAPPAKHDSYTVTVIDGY